MDRPDLEPTLYDPEAVARIWQASAALIGMQVTEVAEEMQGQPPAERLEALGNALAWLDYFNDLSNPPTTETYNLSAEDRGVLAALRKAMPSQTDEIMRNNIPA